VLVGPDLTYAGDDDGYVAKVSAIPLSVDTHFISEQNGGTVNLYLRAGPDNNLRNYILLGSMSGTSPGFPLPGGQATLPINWDTITDLVIDLINTPLFFNFLNVLDTAGTQTARIYTRPLPAGFVGTQFYFAFALNNPWDYVSNPVTLEIIP